MHTFGFIVTARIYLHSKGFLCQKQTVILSLVFYQFSSKFRVDCLDAKFSSTFCSTKHNNEETCKVGQACREGGTVKEKLSSHDNTSKKEENIGTELIALSSLINPDLFGFVNEDPSVTSFTYCPHCLVKYLIFSPICVLVLTSSK